jgi:adenine-specific DNA-methyltransferase
MKKKVTGSFYTPNFLASFIVERIKSVLSQCNKLTVLEPSVGNGSFVDVLSNITFTGKTKKIYLKAIDINRKEINNLKKREEKCIIAEYINKDFLTYSKNDTTEYDLIIGNPPYIKKNRLSKNQINSCLQIFKQANLSEKAFKNIWAAFLVRSVKLLADKGILALILPAELLQVKFAEGLRSYIKNEFKRIEIYTFSKLMFECKGQNTIILIGYKKSTEQGVYCAHISDISQIEKNDVFLEKKELIQTIGIKWMHHTLSSDELVLLNNIKESLERIDYYSNSKPGIVTAANNYFIINAETENKYNLYQYTRPIIQKGSFVSSFIIFDKIDYDKLCASGKPTKIICLTENELKNLDEKANFYLAKGESLNIPMRYKCGLRSHWSIIPNISTPPTAFFFKRIHFVPKLLKNTANVLVTDSAYKIEILDGFDINSFIFSFYNSLTLTFAELDGRYYGGGVLELTPSEFKGLPLPYLNITDITFHAFLEMFKTGTDTLTVIKKNDEKLLSTIGLGKAHILTIQNIREKLSAKRLKLSI